MPVFEYRGTDGEGKPVAGTVFGASLDKVAGDLNERGLIITSLTTAISTGNPISDAEVAPDITSPRPVIMTDVVGPLIGKVSNSQLLFFFRQLATMLQAGVGIVQSLDTLAGQSRDPRLMSIIREIGQHVREGRPISAGLQRYPEVFSPLIISLVRTGEKGGILDQSLNQIAEYLEREIELRNLVRRVTIYPKIVVAASIVIILGANAFLSMLGSSSRMSSPLTEPVTWFVLGPFIAGAFLFFRVGVQNPRVRHNYDAVLLRIPGIGTTVHQLAMAKFGRALAALHKGGVPLPEAVQLAADACGSEYLRAKIYTASASLQEGQGIGDTFARTQAFSPIVLDMIRTGETTGNLDFMLNKVGEFYEDEARTRSMQSAHIFGAICLLIVGMYVGYMVISFYSGYFSTLSNAAG